MKIWYRIRRLGSWFPAWTFCQRICAFRRNIPTPFIGPICKKILNQQQVDQLEICGAQTEYCIDATIKMAHGLGYQVVMKHGAASTFDNSFMTAPETNTFFERIWRDRFLKFIN